MQQLASHEAELIHLFELTPDLVCIADKTGYFKKINPAVIEKLGYTTEELMSRPIASFIHPDDREVTRQMRDKLLAGEKLLNFQNRYIAKSGKVVWFEWTSIYIEEKEVVFAIAKDVTERKHAEKEAEEKFVKFQNLARYFKNHVEENRRYLGQELHEELAQLASVIKLHIEWLHDHEEGLSELSRNRAAQARSVTELLINTIRKMSFSISPKMLSDIGLNATLEWQCKELLVLSGIECHFDPRYDEERLSSEIKIDIFRICQEALTNILYHAEANAATVGIDEAANNIVLTITDDGKGFDPEQPWGPGLLSMRERANSINGQLTIYSEPGEGTAICVRIPIAG